VTCSSHFAPWEQPELFSPGQRPAASNVELRALAVELRLGDVAAISKVRRMVSRSQSLGG
jgi:hypothetical protein